MAKIFSASARAGVARVIDPIARALLRAGVTPNAVTVAGTVGVLVGALVFAARGHLVAGALIVTLCALTDVARRRDGPDARRLQPVRRAARLDDGPGRRRRGLRRGRLLAGHARTTRAAAGRRRWSAWSAARSSRTSRPAPRASGSTADVGIAERLERLIIVGVGGLLTASASTGGCRSALWVLAVLSVVTVGQRIVHVVRGQAATRPTVAPSAGAMRDRAGRARATPPAGALVRALPLPVAPADLPRRRRPGRPPPRAGHRSGCARNLRQRGRPRAARRRVRRAGPATALRSYARYWLEAFRLPSLSREQILRRLPAGARRPARRRRRRRHAAAWWRCRTPATGTPPAPGSPPTAGRHHGRRAAQAGGGVRAVPRVPRVARHGDRAADRRASGRRSTCWPTAARRRTWCRCSPTATCPPAASRCGSSAAAPGCRPARRCSPCAPARRCYVRRMWYEPDAPRRRSARAAAGARAGRRARSTSGSGRSPSGSPTSSPTGIAAHPAGLAHAAAAVAATSRRRP